MALQSNVAVRRINTNAHDLGIECGELFDVIVVRRHLCDSDRGPIQWMECKHNILLAEIITQSELMFRHSGHGSELKVRSDFSNLESRHLSLLSNEIHN